LCRRYGVQPTGAHVLRTLGRSKKPLSSTNARWAPRRAAFFYPGPFAPLPRGDGRLVALEGTPLRLLPAPPDAVPQQRPDADGAVADTEPFADNVADSSERPQLRAVPGGAGPTEQQGLELLQLPGRQATWPARDRPNAKAVPLVPAIRLFPP